MFYPVYDHANNVCGTIQVIEPAWNYRVAIHGDIYDFQTRSQLNSWLESKRLHV